MGTRSMVCAVVVVSGLFGGAHAEAVKLPATSPVAAVSLPPAAVRIPGTDYAITFGNRLAPLREAYPDHALLRAIVTWLADNFDLPRSDDLPEVKRETASRIMALHYNGALSDGPQFMRGAPAGLRPVIATYDSSSHTIYLPEDWAGRTPAELSILVHEMVHHLQRLARRKQECAEASETLAFDAQDKWLRLFGSDLETEFQIDGFTRVVAALCIHP
jgi:hypothetical protein